MIALLLLGCLGHPKIVPAPIPTTLALVHTDADLRRWYLPVDGPGGLRPWFFDTGYGATTCDDDLVADLGLRPRGFIWVRGEAGGLWARTVRLPAFRLGDHEVRRLHCVVRDLGSTSSIRDPNEVRVAGVLGNDLARRFDLVLDPSDPSVTLYEPGTAPLPAGPASRLRPEAGVGTRSVARVTVNFDGQVRETKMLVDTGASATFLDGERYGWTPTFVARDVRVRATGKTGGETRDLAWYRLAVTPPGAPPVSIQAGGRHRGPRAPALLGLDVLGQHRVTLAYGAHGIWFEPVTPTETPSWTAWAAARVSPP